MSSNIDLGRWVSPFSGTPWNRKAIFWKNPGESSSGLEAAAETEIVRDKQQTRGYLNEKQISRGWWQQGGLPLSGHLQLCSATWWGANTQLLKHLSMNKGVLIYQLENKATNTQRKKRTWKVQIFLWEVGIFNGTNPWGGWYREDNGLQVMKRLNSQRQYQKKQFIQVAKFPSTRRGKCALNLSLRDPLVPAISEMIASVYCYHAQFFKLMCQYWMEFTNFRLQ